MPGGRFVFNELDLDLVTIEGGACLAPGHKDTGAVHRTKGGMGLRIIRDEKGALPLAIAREEDRPGERLDTGALMTGSEPVAGLLAAVQLAGRL